MKAFFNVALIGLAVASAVPAQAHKLGVGGTGVDEASKLPICDKPLGTVALVEEKAKTDSRLDALPPHLRGMMEMAQAQQGGGMGQAVDPLPLLTRVEAETLDHLEALFPHLRVHAQVAMSALIAPAKGLSDRQRLWMHRRYGQKVIDFALQDRRTGDVRAFVELDDRSHNSAKARERDKITAAGGYRTVRLSGRARPTRSSIAAAVGPVLS